MCFHTSKYENYVWDGNECCSEDWNTLIAGKFNWSRDWWNFAEVSSAHSHTVSRSRTSTKTVQNIINLLHLNLSHQNYWTIFLSENDRAVVPRNKTLLRCIESLGVMKINLSFRLLLLTSSGDLRSNDGPEYSVSVIPFFKMLRSVKPWK